MIYINKNCKFCKLNLVHAHIFNKYNLNVQFCENFRTYLIASFVDILWFKLKENF